MLKHFIRHQLLKIPPVKRRVQEYKARQELQKITQHIERHHLTWQLMLSGQTLRDVGTDKPAAPEKPAVPEYLDSVNWGR